MKTEAPLHAYLPSTIFALGACLCAIHNFHGWGWLIFAAWLTYPQKGKQTLLSYHSNSTIKKK